jgi:hypothetical protein
MENKRALNNVILLINIIILILLIALVMRIRSSYGSELGAFIRHGDIVEKNLASIPQKSAIALRLFFISHYIFIAIALILILKERLKNKLTVLWVNIFSLIMIVLIFAPFTLYVATYTAPIFSVPCITR